MNYGMVQYAVIDIIEYEQRSWVTRFGRMLSMDKLFF